MNNKNLYIEKNLKKFKNLIQKKRKNLSAQNKAISFLSETNFNQADYDYKIHDKKFEYGYQRINLNLKNPGLQHPYFGLSEFPKSKFSCFFSYTHTGQSAISAAFLVLSKFYGKQVTLPAEGCYYESFAFLRNFNYGFSSVKSGKKTKILLLDTSTQNNLHKIKIPSHCKAVVIDTTCLSLNDNTLKKFITDYVKKGVLFCLVRSHIKIDCTGSEYGRLGSLFYIGPNNLSKLKEFRKEFNSAAGPLGLRGQLSQVYPFLYSKKFHKANDLWIRNIKKSNEYFADSFASITKSKDITIMRFEHNLFCWITFHKLSFEQVQKLEKKLIAKLNDKNIPAFSLASYPWDTMTFTSFEMDGQFDKSVQGKASMRISSGLLSDMKLKEAAALISEMLA